MQAVSCLLHGYSSASEIDSLIPYGIPGKDKLKMPGPPKAPESFLSSFTAVPSAHQSSIPQVGGGVLWSSPSSLYVASGMWATPRDR